MGRCLQLPSGLGYANTKKVEEQNGHGNEAGARFQAPEERRTRDGGGQRLIAAAMYASITRPSLVQRSYHGRLGGSAPRGDVAHRQTFRAISESSMWRLKPAAYPTV